jgi:hypothetical protein
VTTGGALGRFERAVVHVEAHAQLGQAEQVRRRALAWQAHMARLLTRDEYIERTSFKPRRSRGTALLLERAGELLLVSARHVYQLADPTAPPAERPDPLDLSILRVQTWREARGGRDVERLSLLEAGASFGMPGQRLPVTHPGGLDVAALPLSADVAAELRRVGYEPIPSSCIADGPTGVGAEVTMTGFPTACATVDAEARAQGRMLHEPGAIPIMAFGRVAAYDLSLPTFWIDIATGPSFSGAPILEGDTLVGICVSQAVTDEPIPQRLPFASAVRGAILTRLLS